MADKIRMPSSQGGLVRYDDEGESKFQIKPEYVVGAVIVVSVALIVLEYLL